MFRFLNFEEVKNKKIEKTEKKGETFPTFRMTLRTVRWSIIMLVSYNVLFVVFYNVLFVVSYNIVFVVSYNIV